MKLGQFQYINTNQCYRKGPCLHGTSIKVDRASQWDYYDKVTRSYIYLECRLHQKHYTPSLLQIEEAEKFQSGLSSETYETPDLQLADTNGVWFTREDPELYRWSADHDEPKTCNICDLVCDIRDDERYMLEDGSCPYPEPGPEPIYQKVYDEVRPCQDFLHPLLLQDLNAINKKRRRMAKAKLSGYLKQKKWRDALINKEERISDVWKRNYNPVTFYFNSFESVWLYVKNLPSDMKKNKLLVQRIRDNLELSPSFKECLERGDWEKRMLGKINYLASV